MKRVLMLLLFLTYYLFSPTSLFAKDYEEQLIENFESQIWINQDSSIYVMERIDYYAPYEKHGIYRYIPERYRENGQIVTNPIYDIQVESTDGSVMKKEITRENGNVVIKIGDPDKTFTGRKGYVIKYFVTNAIKQQDGFDELYWDITGEGWSFPILQAKTKIVSEFADIQEVKCFTGKVGGTESDCTANWEVKATEVETQKPMVYGENFTVAVKLDPNNTLIFPSVAENLWTWMRNNLAYVLLPLPGLIMFLYWYKKGRDFRFVSSNVFDMDPKQPQRTVGVFEKQRVPLVYEPIKELTPGELGAMFDEKVDNHDVIAEIVDLCRKKVVKIEKIKNKGFLKWGHDYLLTKLKEPVGLPKHQEYLTNKIFGSNKEIKLSELKGKFYTHMTKVKEMIYDSLTEKKLFTEKPMNSTLKGFGLAILMDTAVFIASMESITFLLSWRLVLIIIVSFGLSIYFALRMVRKTAMGTNYYLQARGLQRTIKIGKWREEIKEKHLFIEEVLPYAISLGVIAKLAKDMSALNIEPPKYFNGGSALNAAAWSGFMNDFSKSAQSGLSYNPSSSSSGGSGFSGGSSGGGGGGGGGGSW